MRDEYGNGHFANACLLARRLAERGVRFVQVYYGNGQPWDTHSKHHEHDAEAGQRHRPADRGAADRPEAARPARRHAGDLGRRVRPHADLRRTATAATTTTTASRMWLAGGGVRGGMTYGATDDFGFRAVQNKVHVHDLHATILHLLGLDHEKLTYRYAGRDFRLTDVHGRVVHDIIA